MAKKISISIMAHPSREKFFGYLKSKLGDVPFAIDSDGVGIWENFKRAWMLHDPEAEYHIVVQDDMIIGKDFIKRAEELMTEDKIYNFYMGQRPRFREVVDKAMADGTGFVTQTDICHEACWGMKTSRIKEMIEFCEKFNPKNDRVVNRYINEHKLEVYFPIPSYTSHRNEPSIHNFNKGRYAPGARHFIGE